MNWYDYFFIAVLVLLVLGEADQWRQSWEKTRLARPSAPPEQHFHYYGSKDG
jgi:hypothetical protein